MVGIGIYLILYCFNVQGGWVVKQSYEYFNEPSKSSPLLHVLGTKLRVSSAICLNRENVDAEVGCKHDVTKL